MKVQDFAYNVAARTLELLETQQHYKVPAATRDQILKQILGELNALIKKSA